MADGAAGTRLRAEAVPQERLLRLARIQVGRAQREVLVQRVLERWPTPPEGLSGNAGYTRLPAAPVASCALKVQDGCDFLCVLHCAIRGAGRSVAA